MIATSQVKTLVAAAAFAVLASACGAGVQASPATSVQGVSVERAAAPAAIASQSTDCHSTTSARMC